MALLERVTTLLRANLNDLIDRAESPEKMLKQLILDMENQLLQVKTQVAIAVADQHVLERKRDAHQHQAQEWTRKAGLAVLRDRDDLAKQALAQSLMESRSVEAFTQQLDDQRAQADTLRTSYLKLQQKLTETKTRQEALVAMERRAKVIGKAQKSTASLPQGAIDRYEEHVLQQSATNYAHDLLNAPDLSESLVEMERDEQVNLLLEQLKSQRALAG